MSIKKLGFPSYIYYGFNLLGPLNKNSVSLRFGIPNKSIVNLSTPIANPPCGGHPCLKKSK